MPVRRFSANPARICYSSVVGLVSVSVREIDQDVQMNDHTVPAVIAQLRCITVAPQSL